MLVIKEKPAHFFWVPSLTKIRCALPPLARPRLRARRCCSHAPGAHGGRTGVSVLQPLVAVGRCWLRAASGECLRSRSGNSAVACAARVAGFFFVLLGGGILCDIFRREAARVSGQTQRARTELKRGDPGSSAPRLRSRFSLLLTFCRWKYLSSAAVRSEREARAHGERDPLASLLFFPPTHTRLDYFFSCLGDCNLFRSSRGGPC